MNAGSTNHHAGHHHAGHLAAGCAAALLLAGAAGAQLANQGRGTHDLADHLGPDSGNDLVQAGAQLDGRLGKARSMAAGTVQQGLGTRGAGAASTLPSHGQCGHPLPPTFPLRMDREVLAVQLDGAVTFEIALGTNHPIPYGPDTPGADPQDLSVPASPIGTRDVTPRRQTMTPPQYLPPAQMGPGHVTLGAAGIVGSAASSELAPRRQTLTPPQWGPDQATIDAGGLSASVAERGHRPRRMTIVPPQLPNQSQLPPQVQQVLLHVAVVGQSGQPVTHGLARSVRGPGTPATMPDPPDGSSNLILPLPDAGQIQILLRAAYVLDSGQVVAGSSVMLGLSGQGIQ